MNMKQITFEIESNEELWRLFDQSLNHVLLHKFMPHEPIEWWKTDVKTADGKEFKNLSVRQMEMDVQTDLFGLQKILSLNTSYLNVYQFNKPIPDTLEIEKLPETSKEKILAQNGLQHVFFIHFEFVTIGSFQPEFIDAIEAHPDFRDRILERKKLIKT